MPSGALNEFECTVDAANQSHFQQPSSIHGDVCWMQRDSSRPDSPIRCSGTGVSTNDNDPSKQPALKEDDAGGGNLSGSVKSNHDELVRIRDGFDAWLAAFRKSRPHRDVIWRVGKNKERREGSLQLCVSLLEGDIESSQ